MTVSAPKSEPMSTTGSRSMPEPAPTALAHPLPGRSSAARRRILGKLVALTGWTRLASRSRLTGVAGAADGSAMTGSVIGGTAMTGTAMAGLASLAGCDRGRQAPLSIGTNVWIGSEPLYLARDLGRLDPKRLRLAEYPSASEVLRAFRNEAIDGMVISLDELLGLVADGLDARVVLVVDVSDGADVVVGRAGMQSLRDLRGRRVAVESGAVGALVLSRALELTGMAPGDVVVVHLDSNEQPDAFLRGVVDGAVTFDPYRTRLLEAGATTLFDSSRIPGEIVDLIAVRADLIGPAAAALAQLLTGWFDAVDYIAREPLDAARRMAIRQQSGAVDFLGALRLLHLPSRDENLAMLAGDEPRLAEVALRLARVMSDNGLLPATLGPSLPGIMARVLAPGPLLALAGDRQGAAARHAGVPAG